MPHTFMFLRARVVLMRVVCLFLQSVGQICFALASVAKKTQESEDLMPASGGTDASLLMPASGGGADKLHCGKIRVCKLASTPQSRRKLHLAQDCGALKADAPLEFEDYEASTLVPLLKGSPDLFCRQKRCQLQLQNQLDVAAVNDECGLPAAATGSVDKQFIIKGNKKITAAMRAGLV